MLVCKRLTLPVINRKLQRHKIFVLQKLKTLQIISSYNPALTPKYYIKIQHQDNTSAVRIWFILTLLQQCVHHCTNHKCSASSSTETVGHSDESQTRPHAHSPRDGSNLQEARRKIFQQVYTSWMANVLTPHQELV